MRRFGAVVVAVVLGGFPSIVLAAAPDGRDCAKFVEIPSARCAEWNTRNPKGRLWCHWNLTTGALDSIFGHDEPAATSGLDLASITRESARSDNAKRTLLEAYGRQ